MQSNKFYNQFEDKTVYPTFLHSFPDEEPKVFELIDAFQRLSNSPFATVFVGRISLQLPKGVDRTDFEADYLDDTEFYFPGEKNITMLRTDCPLSSLGPYGSNDRNPLVIQEIKSLR